MKKLKVNYDVKNDVLYLSFGDPRPSYTEDYVEGVYVRYDMETDELSGITIVDFSLRQSQLKGIDFPGDVSIDEVNELIH